MKKTFLMSAISLCMFILFFSSCSVAKDYYTKDEIDDKLDNASEVVAWGNITSSGAILLNSSPNYTINHTASSGIYTIIWTGGFTSVTTECVIIATPYSTNGIIINYAVGGTGATLWFYTYNSAGVATDCGFTFAVIKK